MKTDSHPRARSACRRFALLVALNVTVFFSQGCRTLVLGLAGVTPISAKEAIILKVIMHIYGVDLEGRVRSKAAAPAQTNYTVTAPGGQTVSVNVPGFADSAVVGDFDHDGNSGDVALVMSASASVTVVRFSASSFTLSTAGTYPTGAGTTPVGIAAGDVDGDGWPDLVTGNTGTGGTGSVSVLRGVADGSFAAPSVLARSAAVPDVGLGDFNGDGKLDLAMPGGVTRRVVIKAGAGDGTFGPDVAVTTPEFPASLKVVDFNPEVDGFDDIVTNGSLLLGRGDGTFAAPVNLVPGGSPNGVWVEDLNQDGRPDIVLGYRGSSNLATVRHGDGHGGLSAPQTYFMSGSPQAMIAEEGSTAGQRDLLFSNGGSDGAYLPARADGTYIGVRALPTRPAPATWSGAEGAAVADFTGDGVPDIVAGNYATVTLLHGLAGGGFSEPGVVPGLTGTRAVTGDWNGDGRPDLALTGLGSAPDYAPSLVVALGLGGGSFGSPTASPLPAAQNSASPELVTAFLNADAFPDLVLAHFPSGKVVAWLGDGAGGFTQKPAVDFFTPPSSVDLSAVGGVTVGDFNGDTHADVALAWVGTFGGFTGGLKLALGNGDGTFQSPQTLRSAINGLGVSAADFNRDGELDLAVSLQSSALEWDVAIHLGNGNGTFAAPAPLHLDDTLLRGLATVDADRDGKPDLAVASGGGVIALRGLGDGSFARAGKVVAGGGVPQFPDLNRDGWPDVLTAGGGGLLGLYVSEAPTVAGQALALARDGGDLMVSWPEFYPDYQLEESTSLGGFTPSTRPVTTQDGFFTSPVDPQEAPQQFFRLRPKHP